MTNAFLEEFYPDAHAAFFDVGVADKGSYSAQGTAGIPCRVFVDRDQTSAALAGVEISKDQALVRVLRADVAAVPRDGDVITVDTETAGTETFRVARRVAGDEGLWWLVCQA